MRVFLQENNNDFQEKVSKLLEMGIDENRAKSVLQQTNGDVDSAMAILFS